MRAGAIALSTLLSVIATVRGEPLNLTLPTDNDGLLRGDGPAFYQYIERDYKGEKSTPWEGGRYGYVRNPRETSAGIVYTRMHEGVDIPPLERDPTGDPLHAARRLV